MYEDSNLIEIRKDQHIELALSDDVEGPRSTWLEYVELVHQAAPSINVNQIDLSTEFLGYKLKMPLIIAPITGGTSKAFDINRKLATVAEEYGIAIAVGSQRIALVKRSNDVLKSFKIVREIARSVPVIANIGVAQLKTLTPEDLEYIVSMIEADALSIHLNVLQELIQPEGDVEVRLDYEKLKDIIDYLSVPVIIKEVGFGISKEVTERLASIGVKIFDVAGCGGTNWVRIETKRCRDELMKEIAQSFLSWGLPTAVSIVEVRHVLNNDGIVIASGGIRNGIDAIKAISLGADLVAIARPFLVHAVKGSLNFFIEKIKREMIITLALLNCRSVKEAVNAPIVITSKLAEWICARKLKLRNRQSYICCTCYSTH